MCLIVFAWQAHPHYRLIVAANRDELHQRAALAAGWWPEEPTVLAGRDLQADGTWLAIARSGRFATVTNYHEHRHIDGAPKSRGALVTAFVTAEEGPQTYVEALDESQYAGFSLLAAEGDELAYVSNRGDPPRLLPPGIYGLSNAALDTPWPKLVRSRERLRELLQADAVAEEDLLHLLADRTPAEVSVSDDLPFTLAQNISSPFIVSSEYGTRCSTALLFTHDGQITFNERRFDSDGAISGESHFSFVVS